MLVFHVFFFLFCIFCSYAAVDRHGKSIARVDSHSSWGFKESSILIYTMYTVLCVCVCGPVPTPPCHWQQFFKYLSCPAALAGLEQKPKQMPCNVGKKSEDCGDCVLVIRHACFRNLTPTQPNPLQAIRKTKPSAIVPLSNR